MVELIVYLLATSAVALTIIVVTDGLMRAAKALMGRDWTP